MKLRRSLRIQGFFGTARSPIMEHDSTIGYTASAVISEQGTVTGWSEGAHRLLGYAAAEIVGRIAALLLAEDVPESTLRSLTDQSRWHRTVRLRHRDGHSVEVGLLAHHRLSDSQGKSEWVVVTPVMDKISPMDNVELLEWAFAQGPCAAAIYDSDLRIRRANKDMERAAGSYGGADARAAFVGDCFAPPSRGDRKGHTSGAGDWQTAASGEFFRDPG
jgi:PAS domain S-box-containing protein